MGSVKIVQIMIQYVCWRTFNAKSKIPGALCILEQSLIEIFSISVEASRFSY